MSTNRCGRSNIREQLGGKTTSLVLWTKFLKVSESYGVSLRLSENQIFIVEYKRNIIYESLTLKLRQRVVRGLTRVWESGCSEVSHILQRSQN